MVILLLVIGFLAGANSASGQDHCSLKVKIVLPNGGEYEYGFLEVRDVPRVIKARYQKGGSDFCDLGLGPVSVVAGHESMCKCGCVD